MKILNKKKILLTNAEALKFLPEDISANIKAKFSLLQNSDSSLDKIENIKNSLKKYDLTEFEIVNLINIRPKGLVNLQNIIEEMVDRLTETQMLEIIDILKH